MRRLALLILVVAGCGGTSAAPTPTTSPGARVPRAGDDWPFTVAGGWVDCVEEARTGRMLVYLTVDDELQTTYGLNGSARGSEIFEGFDAMDLLGRGRVPADAQPFIDLGLTLC